MWLVETQFLQYICTRGGVGVHMAVWCARLYTMMVPNDDLFYFHWEAKRGFQCNHQPKHPHSIYVSHTYWQKERLYTWEIWNYSFPILNPTHSSWQLLNFSYNRIQSPWKINFTIWFTKNKDFPLVRFKEVVVSQLEEDETLWQFLSWHIPSASGLLMRKHCARQSSKISHTVRAKVDKHVVTEEAKEIALDVYIHDILLLLELIGRFISCAQRHSWIGCLNTKTRANQPTSLPL